MRQFRIAEYDVAISENSACRDQQFSYTYFNIVVVMDVA